MSWQFELGWTFGYLLCDQLYHMCVILELSRKYLKSALTKFWTFRIFFEIMCPTFQIATFIMLLLCTTFQIAAFTMQLFCTTFQIAAFVMQWLCTTFQIAASIMHLLALHSDSCIHYALATYNGLSVAHVWVYICWGLICLLFVL